MAAPGFSVSELIRAAAELKRVYDAFFDEYGNSQSRVKELAETISIFQLNLSDHDLILKRSGRDYPGHIAFDRTLKECNTFIQRYGALLGKPSNRTEKGWKTFCWPFEEQTKLFSDDEGLPDMHSFGRQSTLVSAESSSPSPLPERPRSAGPQIVELYNDVQIKQNGQKPINNVAIQTGRQATRTEPNTDLQLTISKWRETQLKNGLSDEHLPQLPQNNPLDFSEQYWKRALTASVQSSQAPNHTTGDQISPAPASPDGPRSPSARKQSLANPPPTPLPTPPSQGGSGLLEPLTNLSPAALEACLATMVSFLQEHAIIINGLERYNDDPVYKFVQAEDCNMFQSSIRNKNLMCTFEISKIASEVSRDKGEATFQHLKLWKNFSNQDHAITFFANLRDLRHMEFPVAWFQALVEMDKEKPIRLEFHKPKRSSRSWQNSWDAVRRLSTARTTASEFTPFNSQTGSQIPATPRTLSVASSASTECDDEYRSIPDNEALRMKHLDITFSDKRDRNRFTTAWKIAHAASLASSSFEFSPHND
ncbi:MAG: hypothetical protein Q9217_001115 [Psora testacea]